MNQPDGHKTSATACYGSAGSLTAATGAARAAARAAGCNVHDDGINVVGLSPARSVVCDVFDEKLQVADDGYGVTAGVQIMTVVDGSGDNGSALRDRRARCEKGIACSRGDCPWGRGSGVHGDRVRPIHGLRITGLSVSDQAANRVAIRADRVSIQRVQGIAASYHDVRIAKLHVTFELVFALTADCQLIVLAGRSDAVERPGLPNHSCRVSSWMRDGTVRDKGAAGIASAAGVCRRQVRRIAIGHQERFQATHTKSRTSGVS